jgi:HAE1 family hydrophobic/amphiphilic exporter-1
MNFIRGAISQPVTVVVGVVLVLLAGMVALQRIAVQLTPNVEDTVVAVSTHWEGASPEEIEQEIVDEQEDKLQGLSNLRSMTSESTYGEGSIRLEFAVGTPKEVALREVSDKLREVPEYPANADEPVISATDPENQDYIAWIVFGSTDSSLDIRTQHDFAEDRIKPVLERIPGVAEINVLGGRERETQIRFDPVRLAQLGLTHGQLVEAIQRTNRNVSAGQRADAKVDVRVRTVSQYTSVEDVRNTVVAQTAGGLVYVRDVAEVVETYKEPTGFVRSKGRPVIAINAQREVGSNVMEVMEGLKRAVAGLVADGGPLDARAKQLGSDGEFYLEQVYDQTIYIDDAIALVQNNIWLGGGLAVLILLLFLRSVRSVGVIALAIPISVIGAIVVMVTMGRSINVVSLAGMAFAVGMVVDNAIVVLENIYRHLEMGKRPMVAAYDGAREVWGAILASTLTTIAVFVPILLIQEDAGQLFRDIALAICAAVGLSLIVAVTVIPCAASRVFRQMKPSGAKVSAAHADALRNRKAGKPFVAAVMTTGWQMVRTAVAAPRRIPDWVAGFVYRLEGSWMARLLVVCMFTVVAIWGSMALMPPIDYLPQGNRNLVFGLLIPPPGYNVEMQSTLGDRMEETIRPFWELGDLIPGTPEHAQAEANLPSIPTFDWAQGGPGEPVVPAAVTNYFVVSRGDIMFHGGVSQDAARVADLVALMQHATRGERLPGVNAFANQAALFRVGGSSGSAVKIDFSGDDLNRVAVAAESVYHDLGGKYGYETVRPSPSNFNIFGPELRISPRLRALADVQMAPADLALAVQAQGDGAIIGDYRIAGDTIDLKLVDKNAVDATDLGDMGAVPIATPTGHVVPLSTLADVTRITSAPQINHVGRQRSVTLQFTAPKGMPLEQAIAHIDDSIAAQRQAGTVPPDVATGYAGSASKLQSVQNALLGDGSILGTLQSSMFLALIVVYLVMCVLFQDFLKPLIIMFSVPLATLGGFAGLAIVHAWSVQDRYMPVQTLDVLTMLGFVLLIGVVVNNAILIVHQSINFMEGRADVAGKENVKMEPRRAIAEAVRTRIRPIFMSTFTSVCGMLPLVLMPGSGSELYRGLGSVVVGGLLVSTFFTILLVPMLLSLSIDLERVLGLQARRAAAAMGGAAAASPTRSSER